MSAVHCAVKQELTNIQFLCFCCIFPFRRGPITFLSSGWRVSITRLARICAHTRYSSNVFKYFYYMHFYKGKIEMKEMQPIFPHIIIINWTGSYWIDPVVSLLWAAMSAPPFHQLQYVIHTMAMCQLGIFCTRGACSQKTTNISTQWKNQK